MVGFFVYAGRMVGFSVYAGAQIREAQDLNSFPPRIPVLFFSTNCFKQEVYSFPHLSSPTRADSYIHRQCNHPCAQHRCKHQGIRHHRTVSTQPTLSRAPVRPTSVRLRIDNTPHPTSTTYIDTTSIHARIHTTDVRASSPDHQRQCGAELSRSGAEVKVRFPFRFLGGS